MIPTLIHRYTLPLELVMEQLLGGEAAAGSEAWQVSIEGDDLIIDLFTPGPAFSGEIDRSPEREAAYRAREASNETAKSTVAPPEAEAPPAEPPRKGGALARQAGIICGEKGFWTFVAKKCGVTIASADEAAFWLKERCGVTSRIDFDHDAGRAANFREIDKAYQLWLDGYE